ncbi:spermidine/putrescine ABC transporter ATP-binding subunit [Rhodoligotrophos appendicifer]|uniref:ABC transporter ATP-binding protein n=1 Tax=Rhodoligotrophos appendicifer TaxID=987056 RepID=UPI001184B23B|nr:ABC transporter ATP-binding protein [Rhodoligotrophos appendicifer]
MASVSLRGVSKRYGDIDAVRPLDFDVAESEFLVLLGPSGCGKTTTLRMIAGFAQPTTGEIRIGGSDVTALPPRLRNIGMVFQNYALFPNMDVAENVGFGLRERGLPRAEITARVDELLAMVQLSGRKNAFVGQLSGGQQQRVALARALAFYPKLLLMDEPLGALDLKMREAMQMELHRIQRSLGITTIMVTHDQQEAMSLADRIVVMAGGGIEQAGTPETLYSQPRTRFVASFIGKNNLIPGRITEIAEQDCIVRVAEFFDVRVRRVRNVQPGQMVDISVRPEHLQLMLPPSPGVNVVTGTVEARRFLGNVVYYSVRLPDASYLLVEDPMTGVSVGEGEHVGVGWKVEAGILFSEEISPNERSAPGSGAIL